jgi:hypothetical protein
MEIKVEYKRFVLEIHVSSGAHNCSCGLQKKHGSPIQISNAISNVSVEPSGTTSP